MFSCDTNNNDMTKSTTHGGLKQKNNTARSMTCVT